MSVSPDDPRPSYVQVADDLRGAIDGGEYQAGQRLPSGRELAKMYGVALNTVQRAVERLKAEGVLVSYPPRGVFVPAAGAEPTAEVTGRSPEYVEIMSRIDDLRTAWREQVASFEARLTKLEQAAGRSGQERGKAARSAPPTSKQSTPRRLRGS